MESKLFHTEAMDDGFEELQNILKKFEISEDEVLRAMEGTAKELCADLRKLPKPRSNVRKAGYTHLIDTFAYKREKNEIEVGWGKYYGPMVENGTVRAHVTPHLRPYFKVNQKRIYDTVIKKLWK